MHSIFGDIAEYTVHAYTQHSQATTIILHNRKVLPAARQTRLATDRQRTHECRAAEQPAARQTRLATDRQRTHERRAVEQPKARQARLERLARKTT